MRLPMSSGLAGFENDSVLEQSPSRSGHFIKLVIGVIVVALALNLFWPEFSVRHAEGVLVPNAPYQGPPTIANVWAMDEFTFTPLAEIDMEARVLHKKRYRFGKTSELSQFDLALGWGAMSDQYIFDRLSFSQRGRWYFFQSKEQHMPLAPSVALNSSSNWHTIASSDEVQDAIANLKVGHIIHLKGQLVNVNTNDGWRWQSSMSRSDRGDGSCELIWVESVEVINAGQ
ncbi:MAG: hypothetical protein O7G85_04160 [Planctomycetota bacterium]|nr:hypothetical protein [Planctomycetota bacterium]